MWVYDVARNIRTRLTFTQRAMGGSAWHSDGDRIVFEGTGIFSKRADGTGATQTLAQGNAMAVGSGPELSRDGRFLVYTSAGKAGIDLWYVSLDGDKKPVPFLEAPGDQRAPQFSPDGRYLAYVSSESGRAEIYVRPFPSGEGQWQVTFQGEYLPRWSRTGDKLYFVEAATTLMEVDVATRPSLTLGSRRKVLSLGAGWLYGYDVSPDGKRFLVVQPASGGDSRTPAITVVENWYAEFKSRDKK